MNRERGERRFFWSAATLVVLAAIWSWNEPLLNSHSYRQTQTAQLAEIFLMEGWNPFLTKLRFIGKPGYTVLEFPLYQSLMAGIVSLTGLSLEMSGRLTSLVGAILLGIGVLRLANDILKRASPDSEGLPREKGFLLLFGSPLVFAMSQWVTIEMLNCALGIWSYIYFKDTLENPSNRVWPKAFLASSLALASLSIKPNVLFALAPLYIYSGFLNLILGRRRATDLGLPLWRNGLVLIVMMGVAVALAGAWYSYASHTNMQYNSPFSNQDGALLFDHYKIYEPRVFMRLAMRFSLYVLGPGTIVIALCAAWGSGWDSLRQRLMTHRALILTCLLGIFLYLAVITGGNYRHNYYQLAAVAPLFLALLLMLPLDRVKAGQGAFLAAIALNAAVAGHFLLRQDKNWKAAVAYLEQHISKGIDLPTLNVYSNEGASGPILSYYLKRYLVMIEMAAISKDPVSNTPWVAVCDDRTDGPCDEPFQELKSRAFSVKEFNHLRIYMGDA